MQVYLPALCVGLIVGVYWARVLRLVLKARRRTPGAANFLPPEPLGRMLRIFWYPTVAVWIVHPLMSAFAFHLPDFMQRLYQRALLEWIGVAAAGAALLMTLVCWKRMGKSWRMGINPAEKTELIVTGPFAYVRHPIYALSSLLMLATVLAVPTPLMLIVAAIHIGFLQWEARREEAYLRRVHGATYEQYVSRVGRFLPRTLRPFSASCQ